MIVSEPSPITASRTRITVSSGWNSREVSLNGRLIGVTASTPGRAAESVDQDRLARADLADHRDHRPPGADVIERGQSLGQDLALDPEDLGLAGADGHHDEHRARVSSVARRSFGQTKKQRSNLCLARPTRRVPRSSDRKRSCRASKVEESVHVRAWTVAIGALDVNAAPLPPPRPPRSPRRAVAAPRGRAGRLVAPDARLPPTVASHASNVVRGLAHAVQSREVCTRRKELPIDGRDVASKARTRRFRPWSGRASDVGCICCNGGVACARMSARTRHRGMTRVPIRRSGVRRGLAP